MLNTQSHKIDKKNRFNALKRVFFIGLVCLGMLCELNKMTDVMGIITACLGSIEKQLFRVSYFNPVGIALTSFSNYYV